MLELTDFINQIDLTDSYRTFHANTKEYAFFSALHGTFSKTEYIIRHKPSINRYKKITPCVLSDHHGLKLDINNHRNNRKLVTSRKLNNSLLNEIWVKTKMNNEIKNFLEFNANE